MKKILSLLVLFLCVGTPAAMAAGSKIAYVDTQAVLEKTKYGQKTQGIIREYYENRKKILDMDEDELRKLIEDYKKQESVLNEKAKNEKRELISRKDGEFRKKEAQFNDELRRKQAELFNEFDQKLSEIVKEVAKREKADLVISKTITLPQVEQKLVLYAEEGLDLTQKVVEEMDKKVAAKN